MNRLRNIIAVMAIALSVASANATTWYWGQQQSAAWTSATAQDTTITVISQGYSTVAISVQATSTMTAGTLNFEASNDNGSTYPFALACARVDSSAIETTFALSVTNQAWQCSGSGLTNVRVRLNPAITGSGTATVKLQTTEAPMINTAVKDAGIAGNPISTGQGPPDSGTQRVFVGQKQTYAFATTAKTVTAAGTGPFFSICGSATKTVRLQQLVIGGTVATAAVYADVELTMTSAATSAGTATALTKVPHDSTNSASTVNLLNYYTALATAGTAVGKIGSQGAVFPITATVAAQQASVIWDWTNRQESQAPVLRGTAQCVEASFGTTTTNAPTLTVQGIYTEE